MAAQEDATVGTIGAGNVARTIARGAVAAGRRVVLSNSRGPESLRSLVEELGSGASAGTGADAAAADIVVLAVKWAQVPDALPEGVDWTGKIVVDATNQWLNDDPGQAVDTGEQTGSEYIASLVPGARVVKAFNTVFAEIVADRLGRKDDRLVVFLAGDDADARAAVSSLIDAMGLVPIDLGGLRDGGRLMQAGGPLVAQHLAKFG